MPPEVVDKKAYRARSGVSKYGFGRGFAPHKLRHAFATDLIRHGAPVQDVSRMLGHKKLETTQVYTRLAPMDLKRCHTRYHPRGE